MFFQLAVFLSVSLISYHLLLQGNIPDINVAEAESGEPQSGENQEPVAGDGGGSAGKISCGRLLVKRIIKDAFLQSLDESVVKSDGNNLFL